MNNPCRNECITRYSCHPPNEPKDGAVFAPWVRLHVKGKEYTVSNESAPSDRHKTVIKSFEYGLGTASAGSIAKFELVSEGGESYVEFIKAMNKTATNAPEDTKDVFFQFGWIIKRCDGSLEKEETPELNLMIKTAQSNYEGGCIKTTLECTDMMVRHFERRIDGNFGSDDNKMTLKAAIRDVLGRNDPIINVRFVADDNSELMFKYGESNGEGPRAKWPGDQQNALAVVRKWLAGEVTKNGKGTICQYDTQTAELVISESPLPGCNEKTPCTSGWLGTYVVNAGNCTDVISFSPTVDWLLHNNTSGGTPPSGDSGNAQETAEPDCPNMEHAGPQSSPPIPTYTRDNTSPNFTAQRTQEGQAANSRANRDYEIKPGIEAELKILGDPTFFNPVLLKGAYLSIVVINPFSMGDGCTWIARPQCNQVLSNKRWMILGVSHQMEAGKFNTTIKVKLAAPNSDLTQGSGLGGDGMTFDNDDGQPEESI